MKNIANQKNEKQLTANKHAYAHLRVDMHLAVFAPAFSFSLCESEAPANRRMRIASVVRGKCRKIKTT